MIPFNMTAFRRVVMGTAVGVGIVLALIESREAARLRQENDSLRRAQADLNRQIQELQHFQEANASKPDQPSSASTDPGSARPEHNDLLRLRNEVNQLQTETNRLNQQLRVAT